MSHKVIRVIKNDKIFQIERDGKQYYLKKYDLRNLYYGNIKGVLEKIRDADQAPNIIKIHEITKKDQYLEVIEESCQGDTLRKQQTRNHHILKILLDIIKGLLQLKNLKIMHRDIKPDNIVYAEPNFKIIDFETAKIMNQQNDTPIRQSIGIGTWNYRAPQVILKQNYSSKCDIWSLGCVFYFLLFGKDIEFESLTNRQQEIQQQEIQNLIPLKHEYNQIYITLLLSLLQIDEQNRITLKKLHEWVESLNREFNNASSSTQISLNNQINTTQDNNHRREFDVKQFENIMTTLIWREQDPQTEINLYKFWTDQLRSNDVDQQYQISINNLFLTRIKEFEDRGLRFTQFVDIQQIKQQLTTVVELSEYLR